MKYTAALVVLVAAVAAPLASAQTLPPSQCQTSPALVADRWVLGNLTITGSIKRTSVKGGSRIVQTFAVRNNNAAATNVVVASPVWNATISLIKGRAKAPGSKAVTLSTTAVSGVPVIAATPVPTPIAIPSGKTLKVTITYRAVRCPGTGVYLLGPGVVGVGTDPTACWKSTSATNLPTTVCELMYARTKPNRTFRTVSSMDDHFR